MNKSHSPSERIHSSAIISDTAELHSDVSIGPFCVIGPNVKIGKGTVLHSHVVIMGHTTLGERNNVYPFASVGCDPQDLKYRGEKTFLNIGNDNIIREYATLQPGTIQGGGETLINNKNLFMAYTHVAHDCRVGSNNVIANCAQLAGHVTIGNNTLISAQSGVHQFCRIGDFGMTAAGAMVTQDIPPFCQVQGDRARLTGLNIVGMRRNGFSSDTITNIKNVFKILFHSGFPTIDEAIAEIEIQKLNNSDAVGNFIEFVRSSQRGVVRPDGNV